MMSRKNYATIQDGAVRSPYLDKDLKPSTSAKSNLDIEGLIKTGDNTKIEENLNMLRKNGSV